MKTIIQTWVKIWALFPAAYLLWIGLVGLVFIWIYQHLPFFSFHWDWDPGDGDVLNIIYRIASGLPIYGNWANGEILSLYPPLMHYLYVPVHALGIDPLALGRMVNALLMAGSIFLVVNLSTRLASNRIAGLLSGFIFMSMWPEFRASLNFRPDNLVFFLSLLALDRISAAPLYRPWMGACFCLLLGFTKQTSISVILVILGLSLVRKKFLLTVFYVSLVAIPAIAYLEIKNGGFFLASILIGPFTLGGSGLQDVGHLKGLFGNYYGDKLFWIVPLAFQGVFFGILKWLQSRNRILGLILGSLFIDFLLNLKAAQHTGAGGPYLWLHWALVSILCGYAIKSLCDIMAPYLSKNSPMVISTISCLFILYFSSFSKLLATPVVDTSQARALAINHERNLKTLLGDQKGTTWLSVRAPSGILHLGGVVDREMCTVNQALTHWPKSRAATRLLRELALGKYQFVQTGPVYGCGEIKGFTEVIATCFEKMMDSKISFYGWDAPVEIFRHQKSKKCTAYIGSALSQ